LTFSATNEHNSLLNIQRINGQKPELPVKPVTMPCTSQPDCSSWRVWLTARRVSLLMIPLPCWVH